MIFKVFELFKFYCISEMLPEIHIMENVIFSNVSIQFSVTNIGYRLKRLTEKHAGVPIYLIKAENHVTYFGYFAPVFGQDG